MQRERRIVPWILALGIALTPGTASTRQTDAIFSLERLAVGLEFSRTTIALDNSISLSGRARLPELDALEAGVENAVDEAEVDELLARVSYRFNDHFAPYFMFGAAGLAFDDEYALTVSPQPLATVTVPYSDSGAPAFGFGIEGVLMELPWALRLAYGVRMFTFTSSDSTEVDIEAISADLARLNPVSDPKFSTDVTFKEWDFALLLSREFPLNRDFSLIPQLGYRHASISVDAETDVTYAPGIPFYLEGTFERALGGSFSSVTAGVTGSYRQFVSGTLQASFGDEQGFGVLFAYGF